jgi:hypothetical protein
MLKSATLMRYPLSNRIQDGADHQVSKSSTDAVSEDLSFPAVSPKTAPRLPDRL